MSKDGSKCLKKNWKSFREPGELLLNAALQKKKAWILNKKTKK